MSWSQCVQVMRNTFLSVLAHRHAGCCGSWLEYLLPNWCVTDLCNAGRCNCWSVKGLAAAAAAASQTTVLFVNFISACLRCLKVYIVKQQLLCCMAY